MGHINVSYHIGICHAYSTQQHSSVLVHHIAVLYVISYMVPIYRHLSNWDFIFHLAETESWHLLSNGKVYPPARHKHSMVIHDSSIWVYGGMTDLQERSDLWRFDTCKLYLWAKYYYFYVHLRISSRFDSSVDFLILQVIQMFMM